MRAVLSLSLSLWGGRSHTPMNDIASQRKGRRPTHSHPPPPAPLSAFPLLIGLESLLQSLMNTLYSFGLPIVPIFK